MADTALTAFLPGIVPNIPGCPRNTFLSAIRDACIKFCDESWAIRETLAAFDVTSGTQEYTLASADTGRKVLGIVSYQYNGRNLDPKTQAELDVIDQGWRQADAGTPFYYYSPAPGILGLNREPDETITGGQQVVVAVGPTQTATVVDTRLYTEWKEAIERGAMMILKDIDGKSWSDTKSSVYYGKFFNQFVQRARAAAEKGNLRTSTTARMRAWT